MVTSVIQKNTQKNSQSTQDTVPKGSQKYSFKNTRRCISTVFNKIPKTTYTYVYIVYEVRSEMVALRKNIGNIRELSIVLHGSLRVPNRFACFCANPKYASSLVMPAQLLTSTHMFSEETSYLYACKIYIYIFIYLHTYANNIYIYDPCMSSHADVTHVLFQLCLANPPTQRTRRRHPALR